MGLPPPFPIKTIQVLAITALIAELAFIPVLYVVVKIIILTVRIIVMQSYIIISKQQIPGPKREGICLPDTCFFPTRYNNTFPDAFLQAGPDRASTVSDLFQWYLQLRS